MIAPPNKDKVKKPVAKRIGLARLAVWAVVGIAVAGVAYFLTKESDVVAEKKEKVAKKGLIAEVKPEIAQGSAIGEEKPVASAEPKVQRTDTYVDSQGIERYPGGARVPRRNPKKVTFPDRRAVKWTFDSEDEISALVDMEPGDIVVGDMEYGEAFVVDFNNSLTNRIVINENDDPYSRELKEGVIAAKQDLYDAMERGEDIALIMTETRREMRRLFEYKSMIEEEISEIRNSGEYTDEEVTDFVQAANKMLELEGVPPIKMPRLILNKFKRR